MEASERSRLLEKKPLQYACIVEYECTVEHEEKPQPLNLVVLLLFVLIGFCPYVLAISILLEMNVFIVTQPEGWRLPVITKFLAMVPSIVMLSYSFLVRRNPRFRVDPRKIIISSLLITMLVVPALASDWSYTTSFFGQQWSVVLIFGYGVSSILPAVMPLVFMPHMAKFGKIYLTGFFLGGSTSACVFGFLGIIQGTVSISCDNDEPVFNLPFLSVSTIFYISMFITGMSLLAFLTIEFRLEEVRHLFRRFDTCYFTDKGLLLADVQPTEDKDQGKWWLLFMAGTIQFVVMTLVTSLASYSTASYSHQTYYWTTVIRPILSPLFTILAFVYRPHRISQLTKIYLAIMIFCLYDIALAFQSPQPIFKGTLFGSAAAVFSECFVGAVGNFVLPLIIDKLRHGAKSKNEEADRLFQVGVAFQVVSVVGVLITFMSIEVLQLFEAAPICGPTNVTSITS